MHQQLSNVVSITIEGLQHSLELFQNSTESERVKFDKRATLLKEAKKISKWISIFDLEKTGQKNDQSSKLPKLKINNEILESLKSLKSNESVFEPKSSIHKSHERFKNKFRNHLTNLSSKNTANRNLKSMHTDASIITIGSLSLVFDLCRR